MPIARVGAMPQPAPSKNKNDKRKASSNFPSQSKPKGITIEDLKKQTALRLAQEQQQQKIGEGYFVDLSAPTIRQPLADQQVPVYGQFAPSTAFLVQHVHSGFPVAPVSCATMIIYPSGSQQFSCQPHLQQNPQILHQRDVCNRHHDEHVENKPNVQQNSQQPVSVRCQESDPSQRSNSLGSHDMIPQGKPKLPHGLTVHELKEMTKARLQSEAPDTPASHDNARDIPLENRGMSPLDFDSLPETRERTSSRDSGYNNNYIQHGPGSTSSIPSMVQVNQQFREREYGRQPQISPLPSVFQNSSAASGSAFNRPKADTWESLSVASAFSENFGSESVYSVGVATAYSQPNESDHFKHGPSLRGHVPGLVHDDQNHPASAHTSPLHGNRPFDATIGGNRRRAMTHSPRAISIHEDRPILHTDELRIPSFSPSARGALQSRPSRNYSPVLRVNTDLDCSLEGGFGLTRLVGSEHNRARMDSAASLPAKPQDSFELDLHRPNTFDGFPASHSRGDGWSDGISGALTESFLRVSEPDAGPPGFGSSTRSSTLSTASPSNNPWNGGFETNGAPSTFSDSIIGDITNDMGSVLKLSGIGPDRPDRERCHTYPYGNFR